MFESGASAGRGRCRGAGALGDESVPSGVALSSLLRDESIDALDRPRESGGIFADGLDVKALEPGAPFLFESLLSVA